MDEILGDISGGRFRSCEIEQAPSQGSELLGPAWKSSGMEKFRVFSPGGKGIPIPALRSFGGCRFRGAGGSVLAFAMSPLPGDELNQLVKSFFWFTVPTLKLAPEKSS